MGALGLPLVTAEPCTVTVALPVSATVGVSLACVLSCATVAVYDVVPAEKVPMFSDE